MTILGAYDENEMKHIVDELFGVYSSRNTDKGYHGYTRFYDLFFRRIRHKPVKILEVGIGETAAGLDMFGKYFPNSKLFGIDIIPEFKKNEERFEKGKLKIFIGDQADTNFLKEVMEEIGRVDIIIDDGGHYMDQQMTTFQFLYPWVATGGAYVVEDLFTSHEGTWVKDQQGNMIEYLKYLVDLITGREGKTIHIPKDDFERLFLSTVDIITFAWKIAFIFKKGVE